VQPILVDVDTGVDDALAILYAVSHPGLDLVGISCVAGNTDLDQVVANTLAVLDAIEAPPFPVAAGASRPLVEPLHRASEAAPKVHGGNGLGGLILPPATAHELDDEGAVAMLRRQILASPTPVTLVGLAPQTNLALLLRTHPEAAERLERILFMGGSGSAGNVTATAEFNVWQDPEAAWIVLHSGVPITMYGLDVLTRVAVAEAVAHQLARDRHAVRRVAGELLVRRRSRTSGTEAYAGLIGDAGALVLMTHPELFTAKRLPVEISLNGSRRGQTLVDRRPQPREGYQTGLTEPGPLVDVVLNVSAEAAADAYVETLQR
jgi:pyrimidine-specific ribonucleoside hydrolase